MAKNSQVLSSIARRAGRWLLALFYGVVVAATAGALGFMAGRIALSIIGSTAVSRAVVGWVIVILAAAAGILIARSYLRSAGEQRGSDNV